MKWPSRPGEHGGSRHRYIMKFDHGLDLPRRVQIEFSSVIQQRVEESGTEITVDQIWAALESTYLTPDRPLAPVCAAVAKPVNFMVGIRGKSFTVAELTAAGVRRISLATSLYRAAMSGLLDAAREVKDKGTFGYLDHSMTTPEVNGFMQG